MPAVGGTFGGAFGGRFFFSSNIPSSILNNSRIKISGNKLEISVMKLVFGLTVVLVTVKDAKLGDSTITDELDVVVADAKLGDSTVVVLDVVADAVLTDGELIVLTLIACAILMSFQLIIN